MFHFHREKKSNKNRPKNEITKIERKRDLELVSLMTHMFLIGLLVNLSQHLTDDIYVHLSCFA